MGNIKNNKVTIMGELVSNFEYSHETYKEKFYKTYVKIPRLSEASDIIPILVSEKLINADVECIGYNVLVNGCFRSYNRCDENKTRTILYVFVEYIETIENINTDLPSNYIYMDGYICKKPFYRRTPLGREIADLLIAVNRSYGKSDYIPCICWGRNAKFADRLETGTHISIAGRIQSRTYTKKISEDQSEDRIAYEVSVCNLEVIEDDKTGRS